MTDHQVVYTGEDGVFVRWRVARRNIVLADSVLFTYKVGPEERKFTTQTIKGVVKSLSPLKPGSELRNGMTVAVVESGVSCEHAIVIKDMCANCGVDLREKDGRPGERVMQAEGRIAMIHNIPELHVSTKAALKQGWEDIQMLLKKRKLCLLVDLDLTLIHTTHKPDNPNQIRLESVIKYKLGRPPQWYYTKVRPSTSEFLKKMADLFELHIFTLSDRPYAHKIAKILDPDGSLFGTRILSRDECFTKDKKTANVRALFPQGDNLVCIIDDRDDVWQNSESGKPPENLVKVKPYYFFTETGDIHAPQRPIVAPPMAGHIDDEIGVNVEESANKPVEDVDDYLLYLEETLRRIHKSFYEDYDELVAKKKPMPPPHTNVIMRLLRQKILSGCRLVFSGVFNSSVRDRERKKELYRQLLMFGAEIQEEVVPKDEAHSANFTTHVVVDRVWGTKKITDARSLKDQVIIVKLDWLSACLDRWERINERLYEVTDEEVKKLLLSGEMIITTIKNVSSSAALTNLNGVEKPGERVKVDQIKCGTDGEIDVEVVENIEIDSTDISVKVKCPTDILPTPTNNDQSADHDSDVIIDVSDEEADDSDVDMAADIELIIAEST